MNMTEPSLSQEQGQTRQKRRNIFADRMIRDVIVQVSLVAGLILLVWFFTSNFLSQGGKRLGLCF